MIGQKLENRSFKTCYSTDHSITIFFLFQLVIHVTLILKYKEQLLYPMITCSINGFFVLQYLLIPRQSAIQYKNLCTILSKLLTLLLIILLDLDLTILIIAIYERLDLIMSDNSTLKKFENLFMRILALFIIFIHFDIILSIILIYSLLIEINKLLLQKTKENQNLYSNSNATYQNTLSYLDQQWNQRLKLIPQCIIIINISTLKITYKNSYVYEFFKLCFDKEEELDEILLNKLQFSLLNSKIEKIKQLVSQPKINAQQYKKKNLWSHKSDSISLQLSPQQQKQDRSKGTDSLDFIQNTQHTLTDLIHNHNNNSTTNQQLYKQGNLEIYSDQTQQSLMNSNFNYSFSPKKLQLLGQIVFCEQENEVLVTLIDIAKQNELQELISNTEFKQKLIESFSHELRTPLNSAINFLTTCSYDEDSSEYLKENFILPALTSLKMQSFIISDIIDLSQITANSLYCEFREFSVRELVNEISCVFKLQFEMKSIEFNLNLVECTTTILVSDYKRLVQIIANLLQNSLKFSSQGVVILQLTTVQNGIKFVVSDSGLGIESEQLYQLQLLLQSIEQYKDIQLNKTWQGFGLLISAILVNKLAPKDHKFLQIHSQGLYCGTEVSFTIENHSNKNDQVRMRQSTLRESSSRFQNSHEDQFADINGIIFQAAELNTVFSKTFKQTSKINTMKTTKLQSDFHNTDSQSFESLQIKYGQLSPLSPSLITDKLFQANKFTNKFLPQKTMNIRKIFEAEIKDDEELIQAFQKKKKCPCQNLLSVDDEIFNQRSIQLLLGKMGFEVVVAFNGEEAIQKIKEAEPCSKSCQLFNLILMDYQMPIMDGCTATAKLIEMMHQKQIPKIHIVGLTAFTNAVDVTNCLKAGMSDVLSKPLKLKEFREILALI